MGLVANVIEAAGVPTVCLSMIPPLTRRTGAARVVAVGHPMGLAMGLPGDCAGQRGVLQRTLEAATAMETRRSFVELDVDWPEPRGAAIREPETPPPIAQLLSRKPWLLRRLLTGDIP